MNEARMVENQGQRLRAGSSRVLSVGQKASPHHLGVWRSRVSSPSGFQGGADPNRPKVFHYFSTQQS